MNHIKNLISYGLLLISFSAFAAATYVEGQDYIPVPKQVREKKNVKELIASDANKVQVLFFFSYGCPACAKFDPMFEKWVAAHHGSHMALYRFPVSFEADWENLAKLYYVMQDLQPKKDLNAEIFTAIHQQHVDLAQEPAMQKFLVQHGYSAQSVSESFDSYEVRVQAKHADEISVAYNVHETPTIVINGPHSSYLLTPDQTAGDDVKLLQIVSYLVDKEVQALHQ